MCTIYELYLKKYFRADKLQVWLGISTVECTEHTHDWCTMYIIRPFCRLTRRKSVKTFCILTHTHTAAYCELRMERRAVCTSTASKISVARIKTVTGARRPRPNWGPARRQACDAPNNAWLQYIAMLNLSLPFYHVASFYHIAPGLIVVMLYQAYLIFVTNPTNIFV